MTRTVSLSAFLFFLDLGGCGSPRQVPTGGEDVLPEGFSPTERIATLGNDLPIEIVCLKDGSRMRLVPAGSFVMGSSAEELAGALDAMDERYRFPRQA